jgi:hypothetical protein
MRDKTHDEQIERWAEYVRTHDDWKIKLKPFLDAQIIMARRFYGELGKTEEGKKKIFELREMRLAK